MWSRGLLVLNPLFPKKAKPHDSDTDGPDAAVERPVTSRPPRNDARRGRQRAECEQNQPSDQT